MSPFLAVVLVLVLSSTSYAAGRLHGQLSYRIGYRFGYRQGYFDGDRGAWNRRRRDAQAAIVSARTPSAATRTAPAAAPSGGTGTAPVPVPGTATAAVSAARPTNSGPRGGATTQLRAVGSRQGTTYTGSTFAAPLNTNSGRHPTGTLVRRQG